ncbi:DUF2306 domain-containing protein [Maritimibacter sp. UBA3975]|uniref:DUF2306 domain-containing protein n=1 Tax=Maritimibacter sp. UBA3975 TaxID=1946833 RepID=UPI000C09A01B|nr:DUF2306 domain-containing protein [Maritimibacter sp. UBA3975]MAM60892.1 hypothetical protein [Maritimibacter sp.]|tara:strand:+ start:7705 stop:8313 length:609 start_codon:yes stop_codon:yes gene_type:complete
MPRRIFLPIAAPFSVMTAFMSYRFLALGVVPAFPDMVGHIETTRIAFLAHVCAAPIALVTATFQLMPRLRARFPGVHRWSGQVYAIAILIAGLGALVMAPGANGGLVSTLGFGLLAVLWIGFTIAGIINARAGNITAHRRWMIRSFALTFAAVTLRFELFPMVGAGMAYEDAIAILAWASWLPNLAVAEWLLGRPRFSAVPA